MKLSDGKKYLKTDMVKSGDTITIKSEGEWVENQKFTYDDGTPRKDFIIKVDLGGNLYDMRLNGTNRRALIASFGCETELWMGKMAKCEVVKALVAGKMMNTIVLAPLGDPKEIDWEQ